MTIQLIKLAMNMNDLIFVLRCFAFIVSAINISVLANTKLTRKDSLYKYLLVIAVFDSLYSLLLLLVMGVEHNVEVIFSRTLEVICSNKKAYEGTQTRCDSSRYYIFLGLFLFISEFVTSVFQFFNILLEIFLTLQRIFLISNVRSFLRDTNVKRVCTILFLISFFIHMPIIFMDNIEESETRINNMTQIARHYRLNKTMFGKTTVAKSIMTGLSTSRLVLVTLVLLILNIIAIVKYRAYLKKKWELKDLNCKFLN